MRLYSYFILLLAGLFVVSCSKDETIVDPNTQFEIDKQKIRTYLIENNLKADSTPEGVYYIIDFTHDSLTKHPTASSTVKVDYKGYLLNGKVFETNYNQTFSLADVIDGWKIGIPKFKEGERGRLFIPSKLAYGSQSTSSIPANSPLIFEVNLIKVH